MIIKYIYTLHPANQEHEQNGRKVQTDSTFFLKWREKRNLKDARSVSFRSELFTSYI